MLPQVTVLLPTRGTNAPFLAQALRSVWNQTSPTWELLVIRERLSPPIEFPPDPRVRQVANPTGGVTAALNEGMRRARTPFVCTLHDDDLLTPVAVEALTRAIVGHPEVDYFHSARQHVDEHGVPLTGVIPPRDFELSDFVQGGPVKVLHAWRVSAALAIGGMDESLGLHGADDYDFSWRMAEAGFRFQALGECLYLIREHLAAPRLTTHVPLDVQVRELRRIFEKHGVPPEEIERQLASRKAGYLRQALFRDEEDRRARGGLALRPHREHLPTKRWPPAPLPEPTLALAFPNQIHFGNAAWRHRQPRNSAQQLATAGLRLGGRALYLGPGRRPRPLRRTPRFGLLVPGPEQAPEPGRLLREAVPDWGAIPEDTVVIVSYATPVSCTLARGFRRLGFRLVYRHVDAFEPDDCVAELCALADLVTVSHPRVANLPPCSAPVRWIPNGVDRRFFGRPVTGPPPRDLRTGELTLGFWGSFWGERIDWALLRELARRRPTWQWNLIGEVPLPAPALGPNVHLLGSRHPAELAGYLPHLDVALVPFRLDLPMARYANPIKALEYLSGGCPVVSPENPSLEGLPGVFFYRTPDEAEGRILEASRTRLPPETAARLVAENSWESRLALLLRTVAG